MVTAGSAAMGTTSNNSFFALDDFRFPPGSVGRKRRITLSKKFGSQAPVLVSLIGVDIVGQVPRTGMRLLAGTADMDTIESLEGEAVSRSPSTLWPY